MAAESVAGDCLACTYAESINCIASAESKLTACALAFVKYKLLPSVKLLVDFVANRLSNLVSV